MQHYTHIQLTLKIITPTNSLQKIVGDQWHRLMQQKQTLHVKNYQSGFVRIARLSFSTENNVSLYVQSLITVGRRPILAFITIRVKINVCRGAKQGGRGWGVSTPPEFWMGGGLNTCQPPLILRKNFLGGVGSP